MVGAGKEQLTVTAHEKSQDGNNLDELKRKKKGEDVGLWYKQQMMQVERQRSKAETLTYHLKYMEHICINI